MITFVDNFICQHFDKIYQEICSGTTDQAEWRMRTNRYGNRYYSHWDVRANKSNVFESINEFFHLCLNAKKIGGEYEKIERWTKELLMVACMPSGCKTVDADRYSVLVMSSDQFTKFLFSCFDWRITDENPDNEYGQSHLNSYASRIKYFEDCAERGNCKYSSNLLYDLKTPRNDEVHGAREEFFAEHPMCIQRLVYTLYDYITVFYMLTYVCREKNDNRISLRNEICNNTKMPFTFLTTHIVVKCIDEESGAFVTGREEDIRLYRLEMNDTKTAVNPVAGQPGNFEVNYFCKYLISLVNNGEESLPSESFVVEYDFVNGTIVKINIPPYGTPKPEKISIRELVLSSEDLPTDVAWILDTVEQYTEKGEFAEVARQLVMSAVTKTNFSKEAYQRAVNQLKKSLMQQLEAGLPSSLDEFMKAEIQKFYDNFSNSFKNYRGDKDFFKLLDSLDSLYNMFDSSVYDDSTPHITQILNNARNIVNGSKFSNATSASNKSTLQQERVNKLMYLFSMQDKFPQIVEAEIAKLGEMIEQIYINQINYYMDYSSPLRICIQSLLDGIKNEVILRPELKKAQIYAFLVDRFLNDTPDNVIRIVQLCSDTLLHWIDCCEVDGCNAVYELKQKCSSKIKSLRDDRNNREIQMSMIPVNEEEKQMLKQSYNTFVSCIERLKNPNEMRNVPRDSSWILAEIRHDILTKLAQSCGPDSLMQLVCCSLNTQRQIDWFLNYGCGISYEGFPEGSDYHKWEDENQELLKTCKQEISALWNRFASRERLRDGDTYDSKEIDVSNAEMLLIVDYQKNQIQKVYGDHIPNYLKDILDCSEHILPNYAKAMLLREASQPHSCPIESLVLVISAVMRYWGYSSHQVRWSLLDKYVYGDYAKILVSQEALNEFCGMSHLSQQKYLEILLTKYHFACLMPCTCHMIAYRLNFYKGSNGNEVIDQREFFMKMSLMDDIRISYFDYKEFVDLSNVVYLVVDFSKLHPDDEELFTKSTVQMNNYIAVCNKYLEEHLNICPIEEEMMKPSLLRKYWLNKALKGKSPEEQIIVKYLDLYNALNYLGEESGRYKSGWCEEEKKLFHEVIEIVKGKKSEERQKICKDLWNNIFYYRFGVPYDDIKTERLMALIPYFKEEDVNKEMNSLYSHLVYGHKKVTIGNHSVLEGLNLIRTLFERYGQNVEVPFNGQSTAFVDILIAIYKMIQNLKEINESNEST